MQIQLSIETTQPLRGTASTGDRRRTTFEGWLDLLRAIAELVNADGPPIDGYERADERPAVDGAT